MSLKPLSLSVSGVAGALLLSACAGGSTASQDAGAPAGASSAAPPAAAAVAGSPAASGLQQAPAVPGAQPISPGDRVYTADQSSNTVSVIDPARNQVLGTLPLGKTRLDGVLGPVDTEQVNVHGLGFSRDGRFLAAVSVTSNAVQVIDAGTQQVLSTTYVGRSPHEAVFSPDGREVWVAVRGQDYVSVLDAQRGGELRRIRTADGPSKVVFSPDGRSAYVNHFRAEELDVIDVANGEVSARIALPPDVGASSDEAASPDGAEVWLGHPQTGKTTVVDVRQGTVKAVLDTGARTNHPNFVTTAQGAFAWVTVGGLDEIKVYRRGPGAPVPDGAPIATGGKAPHGIWPSPDNSRVYVALQKSDQVVVIDTATRRVLHRLQVGQDPQALVYVAQVGSAPDSPPLSQQGLGGKVQNLPLTTEVAGAKGTATIRGVTGLDEVDVTAHGLAPTTSYDVYARSDTALVKVLTATSDDKGGVDEALALVAFFDNGYRTVLLTAAGQRP